MSNSLHIAQTSATLLGLGLGLAFWGIIIYFIFKHLKKNKNANTKKHKHINTFEEQPIILKDKNKAFYDKLARLIEQWGTLPNHNLQDWVYAFANDDEDGFYTIKIDRAGNYNSSHYELTTLPALLYGVSKVNNEYVNNILLSANSID